MASPARALLAVAHTDTTFERTTSQGRPAWVGKCLHCDARLLLADDGTPLSSATVEHIRPRAIGGDDRLENLAAACAGCNHEKGRRWDHRGARDADLLALVDRLLEKRQRRWRAAPDVEAAWAASAASAPPRRIRSRG